MRRTLVSSTLVAFLSCGPCGSAISNSKVKGAAAQTADAEIVFTSTRDGNRELYSIKADGSGAQRLTRNSGVHTPSDGWAEWSPDGTEIAYMSDPQRHGVFSIYVMRTLDGDIRRVTPEPAGRRDDSEFPTWSPDGANIAYVSPSSGIHIVDSQGSGGRLLTSTHSDGPISWSPDGTKILFATERGRSPGIHVVDVANGETVLVREFSGSYFRPEWSPDGSRIAVASVVGEDSLSLIQVMDADGSNLTQVADDGYQGGVSWSPDGRRLAYASLRGGNSEIIVIGVDGSNPVNITRSPRADFDPHWARRRQ